MRRGHRFRGFRGFRGLFRPSSKGLQCVFRFHPPRVRRASEETPETPETPKIAGQQSVANSSNQGVIKRAKAENNQMVLRFAVIADERICQMISIIPTR
jgi:hypothetical protein